MLQRACLAAAVILLAAFVLGGASCAHQPVGAQSPDGRADRIHALPPTEEGALRVMSFNIRYDNSGDGDDRWAKRRDAVAATIARHKVDVAGLQEALSQQIDDLAERLPDYAWYGVGRDDGEQRGEFVPIFYRKDRFELLSKGQFWLSESPETPGSRSWDAAITRLVTWVELRDKARDVTFFAFNTHFDHLGNRARLHSAELVRERIPMIAGEVPAVLTGDLNCVAKSAPYRALTEAAGDGDGDVRPTLLDARKVCLTDPVGPDSTWNAFREIEPGRTIDYVFVTAGWKVALHAVLDERAGGRFVSDHLPVLADVAPAK